MLTNISEVPALIRYCENAQKTADYKRGLEKIREIGFWDYEHPQQPPRIDNFSQLEIAELLLSSARLYGFLGVIRKNGQEISKNFLTEANRIFIELGLIEQQVLCSNYLALSYWRTGELSEAEIWLQNTTTLHLPRANPARLHTFVVESLVNCTNEVYDVILTQLEKEYANFQECGDPYLLGLFYMNRGIAKKNLGDLDGALCDQTKSRDIFQQSGHRQLLSNSENNLSCYYRAKNDLDKAEVSANRALKIAEKLADVRQIGCVYDEKSLIAFARKDYYAALDFANAAIANLKQTECYGYLVAYLETKIRILHALEDKEKHAVYFQAMKLAERFCSQAVRDRLTDAVNGVPAKLIAESTKSEKLYFPVGCEPSGTVQRINVQTNELSHLGIEKGHVVIVENVGITEGDLIVVINNGECYLGYIERFVEMVILQTGGEPLLFDETEVEILGKVIGYCFGARDSEGNLLVIPLENI